MSTALALASLRPSAKLLLWPLLVPIVLGLALVANRPLASGDLAAETLGQTAFACVSSIALLALALLAAGLVLMRRGAPTRPVLTGALTGLATGTGVAAGYALHCTDDSHPILHALVQPWHRCCRLLQRISGPSPAAMVMPHLARPA